MDALVTKGKTSAELGYSPPDPRSFIPLIEHELGLAAGHQFNAERLLRQLQERLNDGP